jgi:hypothetical protein
MADTDREATRRRVRGWSGIAEAWGKSIPQTKRDAKAGLLPAPRVQGANTLWLYADEIERALEALPRRQYAAPVPKAA